MSREAEGIRQRSEETYFPTVSLAAANLRVFAGLCSESEGKRDKGGFGEARQTPGENDIG